MRAPTQSNPVYKKRLISAMLEQPMFHEMSGAVSHQPRTLSTKAISLVVGLALLSALAVFALLYHHDTATASSPGVIAAVVAPAESSGKAASIARDPAPSAPIEKSAPRAVSSSETGVSHSGDLAVSEPVEFKIKRSRTYQTVGTIGIRLLRVNPRRRTCDLSIQLKNHRSLQRRLQLNRPLQLKPEPSSDSLHITISAIARDSIAGSLSAGPATVSATQ
jgi:hypothetical protein